MEWFSNLFKKPDPQEQMKAYKRQLDKTIRELERERNKLATQEKMLEVQMKQAAKKGQQDSLKIMAKDLVRTRRYGQKFFRMKMQIQAVSMRLVTMQSVGTMTKSMAGVTKAMRMMNGQMNIPQMQGIMQEFERQNEMMGMKEEMINEAIDDAMAGEDDEAEMDEEVNKVMAQMMLDFKAKVDEAAVPGALPVQQQAVAAPGAAVAAAADDDKELEAKLAALKGAM
jgi:charged multivesicular body protein 2A